MKKLKETYVLSGDSVRWCIQCAHREFVHDKEETKQQFFGMVGANQDLDQAYEVLELTTSFARRAFLRPWPKRAAWLAKNAPPGVHVSILCGLSRAVHRVRDDMRYVVFANFWRTLIAIVQGQAPDETKERATEHLIESYTHGGEYLDWVRLGGSPDLIRWLTIRYADRRTT